MELSITHLCCYVYFYSFSSCFFNDIRHMSLNHAKFQRGNKTGLEGHIVTCSLFQTWYVCCSVK